jgi:hypothetical protein
VADAITDLLRFREYRLLEVAAEEAAALLFAAHSSVQQVKIRLDKPEALAGRARSAAVEITRGRGAFGTREEQHDYGTRIEVLQGHEATIELVRLAPGASVDFSEPRRRFEWIVAGAQRLDPPQPGPLARAADEHSSYRAENGETGLLVRCLVKAD